MPITALELMKGALRLIGEAGESETLSAEDAANGLYTLNELLDAWALRRFLVFQVKQDLLAWPAGSQSRTLGPGGQFNLARPIKLEPGCFVRDSSGQDFPLALLGDRSAYDRLTLKGTTTSQYPWAIFYDPAHPIAALFLWRTPSMDVTIAINSRQVLPQFSALTTVVDLPPGYQRCLRYNLAIALHPEYGGGQTLSQAVVAIARESLANIAAINAPRLASPCETAYIARGGRYYDITSGSFVGGTA